MLLGYFSLKGTNFFEVLWSLAAFVVYNLSLILILINSYSTTRNNGAATNIHKFHIEESSESRFWGTVTIFIVYYICSREPMQKNLKLRIGHFFFLQSKFSISFQAPETKRQRFDPSVADLPPEVCDFR